MKPWKRMLPVVLVLLVLTGCGGRKRTAEGDIEIINDTSVTMRYTRFWGQKQYTVTLTEPAAIRVEVKTGAGTLKLEIGTRGEAPIYQGNLSEDMTFTVNAPPDTYQITVTGQEHAGSYRFDWSGKETTDVPGSLRRGSRHPAASSMNSEPDKKEGGTI